MSNEPKIVECVGKCESCPVREQYEELVKSYRFLQNKYNDLFQVTADFYQWFGRLFNEKKN